MHSGGSVLCVSWETPGFAASNVCSWPIVLKNPVEGASEQ